jgi:hypothetical protein
LDEQKIKDKYQPQLDKLCKDCGRGCDSKNIKDNIWCIKDKWDINKSDVDHGFDSDCVCHCCHWVICREIFNDDESFISKELVAGSEQETNSLE